MFRKPHPIPLLFLAATLSLLGALGLWQIERMRWKTALAAQVAQAQSLPVLEALPQEAKALDYRNVRLTGVFLHDKSLLMIGRPKGQSSGFFIVTPFQLEGDGRTILVNRGFSPRGKEARPEGVQAVSGIIRPPRIKRAFSPANRPDKNVWFYEDIAAMSKAAGLALTPVVVEAVAAPEKGVYPMPGDGRIALRNDHLHYAITWFLLAVIALAMFALYHRKPVP